MVHDAPDGQTAGGIVVEHPFLEPSPSLSPLFSICYLMITLSTTTLPDLIVTVPWSVV